MQGMKDAVQRLKRGLRKVGIDTDFESVHPEAVRTALSGLPISSDLLEWYALGAPSDLSIEWFALTLFLYHPTDLAEVQDAYRWVPDKKGLLAPDWDPAWLVIGDWDGDAVVAHTDRPGTPISKWLHDAVNPGPFLIAPDLPTFLQAIGIFAEVVHGKHQGEVFDDEFNLIPEVEEDLDRALAPLLAEEYRRYWIRPD